MGTQLSAIMVRLADAVDTAQSLSDICQAAVAGICDVTGVDRASILLFDPDGVMRFKAWVGLSDAYRAAVEGHTPWSPGSPPQPPLVIPDVYQDAGLTGYRDTFQRENIQSLAFIPIVSRRQVIGKFMLYRAEPDAFDRGELDDALAIGYQIGFAVDRSRTERDSSESRQRMLFALDAAQMGTWEWHLATNSVRWSENLERIHGLPPGTFTGEFSSYEREIHPDDRDRVLVSIRRAMTEDVPHDVEYRIVAPDGTVRWVMGKGVVERDAAGTPVRMSGICMDVSRRKGAEAEIASALQEEAALRARLTRLTEGAQRLLTSVTGETLVDEVLRVATAVVTADGYAVWRRRGDEWHIVASEGLSAAFARTVLRHEGTPKFDRPVIAEDVAGPALLKGRQSQYVREGIVSLVSLPLAIRGAPGASIVFYYRSPHRPTELELQVSTALAQMAAAAISNADLYAEQQRLAVENARLFEEARDANRVKDEFLATLSHELRTPLNVILGRTRRLLDTQASADAIRQNALTIERNAQTLARLVEDLLDVSRFTLGQVTLDMKAVDLQAIVHAVGASLEPTARARGVLLEIDCATDLPALAGDATRLQQVTWNLVTNAIKFTPDGGRVRLSASRSGTTVTIAVADTGIGIAPEFLPHVFEMFRQGEPTGNREHGGLGLGLSIVRRLVELHGGRVTASSDGPGRGSTFRVELPCPAVPAPASVATAILRAPT